MDFSKPISAELADVERALMAMVPGSPQDVYGPVAEFMKRGGKRIRPVLALLSCAAAGGKPSSAVKMAAIIELFHNFTLIHDDIEDDSQMRRSQPTLNVKYGVPIALNSGDAIYTVLWKELADLRAPSAQKEELQKMLSSAFLQVVEGQGLELGWYKSGRLNVTEQEYYTMVGGKTGALLAASCEIGGYLGGANHATRELLRDFGSKIGVAFQIQDDVLNVSGTFEKYKKEIGGDITEGKRTLMVAKTLELASAAERKELEAILLSKTADSSQIRRAIELFRKYGAIDYAAKRAESIVAEAKGLLRALGTSPSAEALASVADFMISRDV